MDGSSPTFNSRAMNFRKKKTLTFQAVTGSCRTFGRQSLCACPLFLVSHGTQYRRPVGRDAGNWPAVCLNTSEEYCKIQH